MKYAGTHRLVVVLSVIVGAGLPSPVAAQSLTAATTEPSQAEAGRLPTMGLLHDFRFPVAELPVGWGWDARRASPFATMSLSQASAQQGAQRPGRALRIAAIIGGAAMVGTGAYLVSTAKPKWAFYPTPFADFRCVDYNPNAGTGAPEVRCSGEKVPGYVLIAGGAALSVLGLIGR
jgi:hypothetical protein